MRLGAVSSRMEQMAMGAVVLAAGMWRFGPTVVDPDLWGHVKFGIDKIESGFRAHGDLYSYLGEGTPLFDPRWAGEVVFNHEWLGEVVMGGVYLWWGPAGLVLVKALLAALAFGILTWWLFRERIEPVRAAAVMLLAVVLLTPTLGTFRPQIFTLLLMIALLVIMSLYNRSPSRWVWALPVIFVLWGNLHGGFLGGIAVAWLWAVTYAITRKVAGRWEPVAAAALSTAALLLNPNGLDHLLFLVETTTIPRPEIVEWAPIVLFGPLGLVYLVLVGVVGYGLVKARRHLDPSLVIPLLGLMAAPLNATRHLQLFVPAVIVLGAPLVATALGDRPERRTTSRFAQAVLLVVVIGAGVFSVGRVASASSCLEIDAVQFGFPVRGVAALADAGVVGNAVVPFNWGQYIIWHLSPDVQVSGDGRRETVYSPEVHQANLDFANGVGDWERILDLAPADLIIQETGTPGADPSRLGEEWHLAYADAVATVFTRSGPDPGLEGDPGLPEGGHGLCFPVGG